MLEDKERVNQLLDFYEALLTDKQIMILNYYYREDFSLAEIAELLNISRSAVHDTIKKCIVNLEDYENKLELLKKFTIRSEIYEKIKEISDDNIKNLIEQCYKTE